MLGIKEITATGLWGFTIVALIGGIYGKLDGFAIFIFFIIALVVSVGLVAMPTENAGEAKRTEGTGSPA